ncbi:MAG: DmsC/YnfH family molybdoenzyme membrane anchor subunit [Bryobacteraceae bacterium]
MIPSRLPNRGEQYGFHFDMTKCIGCKCCVVACNEQNGNPAAINWRRVGELEGGSFPHTQRFHLSMGCNHCVEPSCMIGCPVDAYSKDPFTGIVDHDPDMCIGCQYCTWNCSYGVPQFNEARGVVGKCDMCHHRLLDGASPACANACPQGAIEIEIVNIAAWKRDHSRADMTGLPSSADSLSTTRITRPHVRLEDLRRVDTHRKPRLEHAHPSLVFVLVMTQLALGVYGSLVVAQSSSWIAAGLAFGLIAIALAVAPAHLGRPIHAYRAIRGWKHSWLSREILGLSAFAGAANLFTALLWLGSPYAPLAGFATVTAGIAGVYSSARIYTVRARPAWFSGHTLAEFFLTSAVLGPLVVMAVGTSEPRWLSLLAAGGAAGQFANTLAKRNSLSKSVEFELASAARLMTPFMPYRLAGLAIVGVLGFVLPAAALAIALPGELFGRWMFFSCVVPKSVASTFLRKEIAA